MKIGIFGDSFADVASFDNHPFECFAWPEQLKNIAKPDVIDFYAKCGASTWYSYQIFLEHYKKYDHIVFAYTYHYRWPHLAKELGIRHWNVNAKPQFVNDYKKNESYEDEVIRELSKSYDLLFSPELLTFINKNISRHINLLCYQNNIKLVNLYVVDSNYGDSDGPFRDNYDPEDLLYSSIENLHWVSVQERVKADNKELSIQALVEKYGLPDARYCHMFKHNNTVLAQLVNDLFTQKKTIQTTDIKDWNFYDSDMDKYYQSRMK